MWILDCGGGSAMTLEELREIANKERESQKQFKHSVGVCVAAGCLSQRSDQILADLQAEVKKRGLEKTVKIKGVGCLGLCAAGPLINVMSANNQICKCLN